MVTEITVMQLDKVQLLIGDVVWQTSKC